MSERYGNKNAMAAAVAAVLFGKFFPYRGVVGVGAAPTADRVLSEMEGQGYLRLEGRRAAPRGKRDAVLVLVLAADGRLAKYSPDFKKLADRVLAEAVVREGRLDELIFVAEDELFESKFIQEAIAARRRQLGTVAGPDPEGAAPYLSACHYSAFALEVPAHASVPPHRVLPPAEAAAFLERERKRPADMEYVYESDPPVVWLGARPGQLVEVTRPSETAGKAIAVRYVIPGSAILGKGAAGAKSSTTAAASATKDE